MYAYCLSHGTLSCKVPMIKFFGLDFAFWGQGISGEGLTAYENITFSVKARSFRAGASGPLK